MKLTEQQLQQMFRESHLKEGDQQDINLYGSVAASDKRLADAERIADDSTLSASYHIMNQLHDWSAAIQNDIELSMKPRFYDTMLNWLRPTLATAAIMTTVYFVAPEINQSPVTQPANEDDRIMFTASFENSDDLINVQSFDKQNTQQKPDMITTKNFG